MKNKEIVLYTNDDTDTAFELTKEYLFENYSDKYGWGTPNDVPHSLIYDEIAEQNSIGWYDFTHELKKIINNGYYLMTGKVGRWNGTFDGGKFITDANELLSSIEYLDVVTFTDENETEVTVRVNVNEQAMRRWAMQYALHIKILSPESLVGQIKEDLKMAFSKYN